MSLTLLKSFSRALDQRMTRPARLQYWFDEKPGWGLSAGLALQHMAIQSIYFVIPAALAGSLTSDPAVVTRFLSLSILAAVIWQVLQLLTRGPVGSGYPLPATHTAALIGAYTLLGTSGGDFGTAAALLVITGLASVALTFSIQRLRALLPNEVSGVVVILIGVALAILGGQRLGLNRANLLPAPAALVVVGLCMAVMAGIALSRTRFSTFAVLLGAAVGVPVALLLDQGVPDAMSFLARQPWLALPQPWMPSFEKVNASGLGAFLIARVALKATAVGSLVLVQRGADAQWSRPSTPPIRRGLLANAVAIVLAGLMGAACPGPATAAVGVSIATGTLARRIVWVGSGLLLLLALSPRVVALFVLVPEPVKAAMLFYVAGFIMAQGLQLATARLLDTRRMLVVAFGLCAGIVEASAPQAFLRGVPALASPLAAGALVAFVTHLVTLPLVNRKDQWVWRFGPDFTLGFRRWIEELGGKWALKGDTLHAINQALPELFDVLRELNVDGGTVSAKSVEDRVELILAWDGPPLPSPATSPSPDDLIGSDEVRQGFAVWLAVRHAQAYSVKSAGARQEAMLAFDD